MRLQMIQEMRVEESFKNFRQNTSESYRSVVRRVRAATFFRDRLNKCTLPALRKSISIKAYRVELNEDRRQLGSTLPQNASGNAIRATGLPDVHSFQDPMHPIISNYRYRHGTPERRRSRRRDARIEQGGIR